MRAGPSRKNNPAWVHAQVEKVLTWHLFHCTERDKCTRPASAMRVDNRFLTRKAGSRFLDCQFLGSEPLSADYDFSAFSSGGASVGSFISPSTACCSMEDKPPSLLIGVSS